MFNNHPWIHSAKVDISFIFLPGLLSVIAVLLLNQFQLLPEQVSPWSWLIVVVLFDVGHVWSTIFKTYLHKYATEQFSKELFLIPLICLIGASTIHLYSAAYFWTIMAYIAVFHFIKQQYGFLKIYSRNEKNTYIKKFESIFISLLTLYPIIHWHTNTKTFNWFQKDDFFFFKSTLIDSVMFYVYVTSIVISLLITLINWRKYRILNLPKILLFITTGLVWYVGIVSIDNDWSFTFTNVINHGVPYLTLVYLSSLQGKYTGRFDGVSKLFTGGLVKRVAIFIFVICCLGYFEEFFWDLFVWHEHANVFGGISKIEIDPLAVSLFVGVLSVPQLSHYILDGFIWKRVNKVEEFKF